MAEPALSTPPTDELADDVAEIAVGSSVVLVGWVADQVFKLVLVLALTNLLGTEGYGLYVAVTTILLLAMTFAPMGLDAGTLLLTSRYLKKRPAALGRLLFSATGMALSSGAALAAGLAGVALAYPQWLANPDVATGVLIACPAVALHALCMVPVGSLQGAKAMKDAALALNVARPGSQLLFTVVALVLGLGLPGILVAYWLSYLVGALAAVWLAGRRFQTVLADVGGKLGLHARAMVTEAPKLLWLAVPLTISDVVYRTNLSLDVVMLTWLSDLPTVGVYRAAVTVALFGTLPVAAGIVFFKPVVSELFDAGQLDRLQGVVRATSRWLFVAATPFYLTVALLPELALRPFGAEYVASATALQILIAGQVLHIAFALTTPLLMMSNRQWLNVGNGVVAVGINAALNLWLVPEHGAAGAALASAVATTVWAGLRVLESTYLLKVSPASTRGMLTVGLVLLLGVGGHLSLEGSPMWVRLLGCAAALILFAASIPLVGFSDTDRALGRRLRTRVQGMMAR